MNRLLLVVGAAAGSLSAPAGAWWDFGHRTIASIAWTKLTPSARRQVRRLIAHQRELDTPECPIRSIEDASIWPDCIKKLKDRFSYASSWHYQNIDLCVPFDPKAGCADGNCVTAQIRRNQRLLANPKLPARERLQAFAFLVHLVGDVHQPLHATDYKGDEGGNKQRAVYGDAGMRTNLHKIWDGYLAERAISSPPAGPSGLLSAIPVGRQATWSRGQVRDWTRQSWSVAHDTIYAGAPACGAMPERLRYDETTIQADIPVVREQVAKGGLRLARMLNEALKPAAKRPGSNRSFRA